MRRARRLGEDERGSATAELVILTPLLILFMLLVVALGRLSGARIAVDGAAAQAARAASIARSPAAASTMAEQTAAAALGSERLTCAHLVVSTDTADFAPGGAVAVTVTCSVALSDLSGLRLPVTEAVADRFVAPIDRYRGVSTG